MFAEIHPAPDAGPRSGLADSALKRTGGAEVMRKVYLLALANDSRRRRADIFCRRLAATISSGGGSSHARSSSRGTASRSGNRAT